MATGRWSGILAFIDLCILIAYKLLDLIQDGGQFD